jgi:hypothetical protein
MITDSSFQVYLSTKSADVYKKGVSSVEFHLPVIEIDDLYHIHLSVCSASIPVSFYNINDHNNVLYYKLTADTEITEIVLTKGNYNVNTLLTLLKSVLPAFTITYNIITNKYTFSHPTSNFSFYYNTTYKSTCFHQIGFKEYDQYSSARILENDRCINLSPIRNFLISCNYNTGNINKSNPYANNILCSIPLTSNINGVVNYFSDNFKSNLYTSVMNTITITITDQDGLDIDFNGVNWTMTLQLDIMKYVD